MISISHPASRENFVNRKKILKSLGEAYQRGNNVALVGPRRIGKSSIAEEFLTKKELKEVVKVIFDVSYNMGTPGRFAVRMLISFLGAYFNLEKENRDLIKFLEEAEINPGNLMELAERLGSNTLRRLSQYLITYYPPSRENERETLKRVFIFIEDFAEEKGVEVALVLDEFQTIKDLERFSGLGKDRMLPFLQGIISSQSRVWYLFTGSAVRLMREILEGADSPFYGRVERINVGGFTKEDTIEIVNKVSKKPYSGESIRLLWYITRGNPYYLVVLSSRAEYLAEGKSYIDKKTIEEAFIEEITKGALYSHCQYLFDTSLGRIGKAGSVLKEVMRILSTGIKSPSGLAKRLGRNVSYVSPLLSNLIHIDLIEKDGKRYFISDPVLQVWIEGVYGLRSPKVERIKNRIEQDYREYIEKLKKDTGYFFESYMREMLSRFDRSRFSDRELPVFEKIESLNIFDKTGVVFGRKSNIEIDALCQGKVNWLCEFRYRNEPVTKGDVDLLIRKKQLVEDELNLQIDTVMFISKVGFTETAINNEVWCVDLKELNTLLSKLNLRRI